MPCCHQSHTFIAPCLHTCLAHAVPHMQVQKGAMVAAGSLVTPNTIVPTGEIWAGNPAKKLRALDAEEADFILQSAVNYSALARIHAAENAKTHEEITVGTLLAGPQHIALQPTLCISQQRAGPP